MVIQDYIFSNILVYIINILLGGTFFSYIIYFFSFKNQYQNLIKHDILYNFLKIILTTSLGLSFVLFMYFIYIFYIYYMSVSNYFLFNSYKIVPIIYINYFLFWFEFSIDFFGLILLFLAYFVGILSLLALDNRIF